jgi:alpha-L-fucosidase
LGWPASREAVIHSLGSTALGAKIRSVDLLGSDAKITFEQREDGLHIHLPEHGPGKYAYAFRIVFD